MNISKQKPGVVVLAAVVLLLGTIWLAMLVFVTKDKTPVEPGPTIGVAPGEGKIVEQIQELEALRAQLAPSTKTPAEQERELEALRKKSRSSAPKELDIARQIDELERLRAGR